MKDLEDLIDAQNCLVLDATYRAFIIEHWTESISEVACGEANILIPRSGGKLVRSQNLVFPWPLVIQRLTVVAPFQRKYEDDEIVSKNIIKIRDGRRCVYCGKYGNTIDHILPKSRGGLITWGNAVTACKKCNNGKRNRTPEEAGLKRPKIPKTLPRSLMLEYEEAVYAKLNEV